MDRTSGWQALRSACGRIVIALVLVSTMANAACAVTAEHALAGVSIFSPMSYVLHKFGTPTEVHIGAAGADTSQPGGGGAPSGLPPGVNIPGGFGGGIPGFGGGDNSGGASGTIDSTTGLSNHGTITWLYDQVDAGTLEFTFSADGRVIQIHLTGTHNTAKTHKGIALGAKMGDVMNLYGYPERQTIDGRVLTINYIEKYHVAFQFYNGKLVGIIIAAVD